MKNELLNRTKKFALDCWHFCFKIPKSTADFINKLKIVEEEADESVYWLEIFEEILSDQSEEIIKLKQEGKELLAITVAIN
ncbi:four helix bundle protein [Flavivirga sp. 57AJ16]|uniref:four helix bundle protein n=1 Tax=Flavivirga sp. 57AJ16 TaxID=3025307 RepID=UPI002366A356|nr:four helix bundle protein [Flavivirga sp. 57AJ16]MDD7885785.1 four helix bundle protein [Flavivirga sp. 57AJ16]